MKITVTHRQSCTKSPKVYLIEVESTSISWQVLKRFQQIRDLHQGFKSITNDGYNYQYSEFPKRQLSGSYGQSTILHRITQLNQYFSYLTSDKLLAHHRLLDDFLRSDLYLDSYQSLKEADSLVKDVGKIREITQQLHTLDEEISTKEREHLFIGDKYAILRRNIKGLLERSSQIMGQLTQATCKSRTAHRVRLDINDKIKEIDKLYSGLRCHLSLTCNRQIPTREGLDTLKGRVVQLIDMVDDATRRIRSLEDVALDKGWECGGISTD